MWDKGSWGAGGLGRVAAAPQDIPLDRWWPSPHISRLMSSVPSQRGARNESAVLCYVFPSYLRSCLRTGHLVVGGIFDRVGAGIDGAGGNAGEFALL
jgi:hypothetical protein